MTNYLTIDVGGTQIKHGLMSEKGVLSQTGKQATPEHLEEFLAAISTLLDQYQDQVAGFAFSMPGKIDTSTGTVYFGGALTYLDGLCLPEHFAAYGKPIAVQNDGKAAALAELWLGNLQGVTDGAVIILGTGVGGGVILDGKLRLGAHFQAGEFSLMSADFRSEELSIAGAVNSAVQMVERVNQAAGHSELSDGIAAFEAIAAGNAQARAVFEEYCHSIASHLLSVQAAFDLTTYAIGGGISAQPLLIEEINRQFENLVHSNPYTQMNIPTDIRILPTKFGNDANLYGALYTLLERLKHQ